MPLELYERATVDRFCALGYVLANVDVKKAGVDPESHFKEFGIMEGRNQINPDILGRDSAYRTEKFARFHSMILTDGSSQSATSFPLSLGNEHFELSSYEYEPSNEAFGPFIQELETNPQKNYMDLGCGLRKQVYENCLYVEVYPSITADLIVEPSCRYPIACNSFDGIGCFAVLEHTLKPWLVVEEIYRILKPGGKAFIDWPFLQPVHGFPSHYFNATREGLMSLFADRFEIEVCATFPNQTPDYTVCWVLGKMIHDLPDENLRQRILSMSVRELLDCQPGSVLWREIISALPENMISEFACGNSLIGRKIK